MRFLALFLNFIAFSFSSRGVSLIVMVFLRLGNLFLSGLAIYLLVDDSFHTVLKYLFSSFFIFISKSMIYRFLSYN